MSFTIVSKPQAPERSRILTPNEDQILVGSAEDEILIYQEDGSLWTVIGKDS